MDRALPISKSDYFKKFRVCEVDLIKAGLFTKKDVDELLYFTSRVSIFQKLNTLFCYFWFAIKHPRFLRTFLLPGIVRVLKSPIIKSKGSSKKNLKNLDPVLSNALKASIAASFKPKRLLEIGTYLGWGAASFKTAIPNCEVFTINPKMDRSSNNPIIKKDVGSFYKKKGLKIRQIWADSTQFDYSELPKMDVVYIDGSHKYNDVLKDLNNSTAIVKKAVILDDYVPEGTLNQIYGPWNEGVVTAVNDFLRKRGKVYKYAYWIIGTPLCVLIK